jgi:hypothetical protein
MTADRYVPETRNVAVEVIHGAIITGDGGACLRAVG